eukprot:13361402-Alexandrium_andersonii.AAC.1
MSASLVGSEMCIRDSGMPSRGTVDANEEALLRASSVDTDVPAVDGDELARVRVAQEGDGHGLPARLAEVRARARGTPRLA